MESSYSSKYSNYHKSQTVIDSDVNILGDKIHHPLCVTFNMSCFKSSVICHVSHIIGHHIFFLNLFNLLYFFNFRIKWWSQFVNSLLSTGPTLYSQQTREKPGAALKTPPPLINSLTDCLWKYRYKAATPQWLKMVLLVMEQTMFQFLRRF